MFSQTVEYALRAVVYLASQAPKACTTEQLAETTKVPKAYLSKVLQALRRAGLIHAQRGMRGGVSLIPDPETLTILQVVNAVDPIQRIHVCPLGLPSHGTFLCPLHKRMDDALASVETALGSTTLAELLADPSPSIPLCDAQQLGIRPPMTCKDISSPLVVVDAPEVRNGEVRTGGPG